MNKNVTSIDELLELDEIEDFDDDEEKLESESNIIPQEHVNKINRYIRKDRYKIPSQSGMIDNNHMKEPKYNLSNHRNNPSYHNFDNKLPLLNKINNNTQIMYNQNNDLPRRYQNNSIKSRQHIPRQQFHKEQNIHSNYNPNFEHIQNYQQFHPYQQQNNQTENYENKEKSTCSCVSVSDHVLNCKVCTKLYSNDRTIYIITIFMLSIICILLLKKVLNL